MKQNNRIITRALGCVFATVSAIYSMLGNASAMAVSGNVGHAKYEGTENAEIVNGYWLHISKWDVNGGYDYTSCGGSVTSGTGTGAGPVIPTGSADSLPCAWYQCFTSGDNNMARKFNVPGCSSGMCDATGLYCTSSSFFGNYGYTHMGATQWDGRVTSAEYNFIGCDAGWYITKKGGACGTGLSSYAGMDSCCAACPEYVFESGTGITSTGTGDGNSNCNSDWCWVADRDVIGITACHVYANPSNKTFEDKFGTFIVASGCPYIQ
ncbi:MAG: hypothetical protein K2M34_02595 [Alphaproteobacteria bacterium]|nr:hypothetical protein [Alphaproteobacteria bacterium]